MLWLLDLNIIIGKFDYAQRCCDYSWVVIIMITFSFDVLRWIDISNCDVYVLSDVWTYKIYNDDV